MTRSPAASLDVTGYVLAGGRSRRMGQDKALLQVAGTPLVTHALQRLRPVCADVAVLSGPRNPSRDAALATYARIVPDLESGYDGPLAALAAALEDAAQKHTLLLPIDQPGMTSDLLQRLIETAKHGNALAACFALKAEPEPLPLFVSRELSGPVRKAVQAGERRLLRGIQACLRVLGRELLVIDLPANAAHEFSNLNTPEDFLSWREQTRKSNQSAARASEIHDG